MEFDPRVESTNITAVGRDLGTESAISANKIRIHRDADEFVTKHDLVDSRNEIRKGVLLYYYQHDYWHILKDLDYLPEGHGQRDMRVKRPPIEWIVMCYAAGSLSLLLCDPGGGFEFPIPGESIRITPALICAPLAFVLSFILNRYWGRRHAFRMGGVLALMASFAIIPNWNAIAHSRYHPFSVSIFSVTAACILMSTSLLYIVEISEKSTRSRRFATWYFVIVAIGSVVRIPSTIFGFLLPLRLAFILLATLIVLGLSIALPESPYWLVSKGNVRAAYYSLRSLRKTAIEAARDIYQIHDVVTNRPKEFGDDTTSGLAASWLNGTPIRRRRWMVIMFYALLMATRGLSNVFVAKFAMDIKPLNLELAGSGVFVPLSRLILIGIMAQFLNCPRRPTILCLLCVMCILIAVSLGGAVAIPDGVVVIIIVSNSAFTLFHFLADAPILIHISEAFPFRNREMGVSLTISFYTGFTLGLGNLTLLRVGLSGPNSVSLIIILPITSILAFFFLKETRGLSLEHNISEF